MAPIKKHKAPKYILFVFPLVDPIIIIDPNIKNNDPIRLYNFTDGLDARIAKSK